MYFCSASALNWLWVICIYLFDFGIYNLDVLFNIYKFVIHVEIFI